MRAALLAARHRLNLLRNSLRHYSLALAFARDRLTTDQAQDIIVHCERIAGWHPLDTLTVDDALEHALATYAPNPELAAYIAMGCARVGRKYDSDGDALHFAKEWALEEAIAYAAADGITFQALDADAEDVAS